ncbi:MAG: FAD-dependent oxidoreductase [Candidatus Caenarcaniphilales bacterium]|nr:FAD-dependent oxidoreductase [Candidatus Caenarcaniphilales bacterium]
MTQSKIVILGGGYAGLQAALELDSRGYTCTLIDQNPYHELLPELPYRITEPELQTCIPFQSLLKHKHINFHKAKAQKLDFHRRRVILEDGEIEFDYLVLALGSETNYFNIPGLAENSLGFITTSQVDRLNAKVEENLKQASKLNPESEEYKLLMTYIVGGGGLTGVEVAGELLHTLPILAKKYAVNSKDFKIYIIEALDWLMPSGEEALSKAVTSFFQKKPQVEVILKTAIKEGVPGAVKLADERILKADTILWTGGIRANSFFERPFIDAQGQEGKFVLGRGFRIEVDEFMRVKGLERVYAIGDNALLLDQESGKPMPLNGQLASKEGAIVADYLISDLKGQKPNRKTPSMDGVLVSLGPCIGGGTLYKPLKTTLPVNIFSRALKKAVELRYRYLDICR